MSKSRLSELEQSLHRVYLKIYREIKKEPDYLTNYSKIKEKYNRLVYDNTRSAVQEAVIIANEQVNRKFKTQPYLTQSDLDIIKKNSQEQTDSFWRKILLDIFRKQEQQQQQQRLSLTMGGATSAAIEEGLATVAEDLEPTSSPPDLDLNAYLLAVSIASLFGALADATTSKTEELNDTIDTGFGIPEKPKVRWIAVRDQKTCDELPDRSIGCSQRDGNIYETDDPDLLAHMPGTGTHAFCRCLLEPVI